MTCPHKYTGRNPSVVYPAWRTLDQTYDAYWRVGNRHGLDRVLSMIGESDPTVKRIMLTVDWPLTEVAALTAALKDRYDWIDRPQLPPWAGSKSATLYWAYHALKGKMG